MWAKLGYWDPFHIVRDDPGQNRLCVQFMKDEFADIVLVVVG
jgi:hypothetical protein